MRTFVICFAVVAVIAATSARPHDEDHYTTRWDHLDIQQLLHNERLMKSQLGCLKGENKCNPDGQELKRVLPDALSTHCKKCSTKQKEGAKTILRYLIEKKRDWFNQLAAIYDKEGSYLKEYNDELEAGGLKNLLQ